MEKNDLSRQTCTGSMAFRTAENDVERKTSRLLSADGWERYRNELIQLCFEFWEDDDPKSADSEIQPPPSAEKTDDPGTIASCSGAVAALDGCSGGVAAKGAPRSKERAAEAVRPREKSKSFSSRANATEKFVKLRWSSGRNGTACVRQLDLRRECKMQRGLDPAVERIELQRAASVAVVPARGARNSGRRALGAQEKRDAPQQSAAGGGRDAEGTWRASRLQRQAPPDRGSPETATGRQRADGRDGFSEVRRDARAGGSAGKTAFSGFFATLRRAGRFRSWCGAGAARRKRGTSVRKRASDLRRRRRRTRRSSAAEETRFRTGRLEYVRGHAFGDPGRRAGLEVLRRMDALTGSGRAAEAVDLFVSAALPLSDDPESMVRRAEAAYDWKFFCHLSMWRYSYND